MNISAVWIAKGTTFTREAQQSAVSFASYHPDIPCHLITPDTTDTLSLSAFSHVHIVPYDQGKSWYFNCMRYYVSIFDMISDADAYFLFDTDTHICSSIHELERMFFVFDFLGCHAPGRHTTQSILQLGDAFPEINIGFLAFLNKKVVKDTFVKALAFYENNYDLYGNNDQGPLRDALYYMSMHGLKMYALPDEFNFRFNFGGRVRAKVRVLHGRSPNILDVERVINANTDIFRVFKNGKL